MSSCEGQARAATQIKVFVGAIKTLCHVPDITHHALMIPPYNQNPPDKGKLFAKLINLRKCRDTICVLLCMDKWQGIFLGLCKIVKLVFLIVGAG